MSAGQGRIAAAFAQARAERRAALVGYLTVGYPSLAATRELVPALERAGVDVVELGVPFSDPIADGPVIQRAACAALEQGVTPVACLDVATRLRAAGVRIPLVFMGYYNPILAFQGGARSLTPSQPPFSPAVGEGLGMRGPAAYARACRSAGVDGLIVPDLPLEESAELAGACQAESLALIHLVAPGTPEARLRKIGACAQGFLYLVSRPGTTGQRDRLPEGLAAYVERVRRQVSIPLALGFGIGGPAQAQEAARLVDGVVVGSALVERAAQGTAAVEEFARELRAALDGRG